MEKYVRSLAPYHSHRIASHAKTAGKKGLDALLFITLTLSGKDELLLFSYFMELHALFFFSRCCNFWNGSLGFSINTAHTVGMTISKFCCAAKLHLLCGEQIFYIVIWLRSLSLLSLSRSSTSSHFAKLIISKSYFFISLHLYSVSSFNGIRTFFETEVQASHQDSTPRSGQQNRRKCRHGVFRQNYYDKLEMTKGRTSKMEPKALCKHGGNTFSELIENLLCTLADSTALLDIINTYVVQHEHQLHSSSAKNCANLML